MKGTGSSAAGASGSQQSKAAAVAQVSGVRRLFEQQSSSNGRPSTPEQSTGEFGKPTYLEPTSTTDTGTFGRTSMGSPPRSSSPPWPKASIRAVPPPRSSIDSQDVSSTASAPGYRKPPPSEAAVMSSRAKGKQRLIEEDSEEAAGVSSIPFSTSGEMPKVEPVLLDPRQHWSDGVDSVSGVASHVRGRLEASEQASEDPTGTTPSRSSTPSPDRGTGKGERGPVPIASVKQVFSEESRARRKSVDHDLERDRLERFSMPSLPPNPRVTRMGSQSPIKQQAMQRTPSGGGRTLSSPEALRRAQDRSTNGVQLPSPPQASAQDVRARPLSMGYESTPMVLVHSATLSEVETGRSVTPVRPLAAGTRTPTLSFTPGVLPDGTLAAGEMPRRNSSQRARPERSPGPNRHSFYGHGHRQRQSTSGSALPVVSQRWSSGDWYGDQGLTEGLRGLGMSPDVRGSGSAVMAMQTRSQSRFHLSALAALRPRLTDDIKLLRPLRYSSWLARVHHLTLILTTYAHVPLTIFLDYNAIFAVVQLAVYPTEGVSPAAWWIALGIFAFCDAVWLFGTACVWEGIFGFKRRWLSSRPYALPIYLSSPAFTLSAIKSFSLYSLLYRVRFRANKRDFGIETAWYLSQNWPTVLTHLPRAVICATIVALYYRYSLVEVVPERDPTYFSDEFGDLTTYAYIVLLINCGWAGWRLLVLLSSYVWLFCALGPRALFNGSATASAHRVEDADTLPLERYTSEASRRHIYPDDITASVYGAGAGYDAVGDSSLDGDAAPSPAWAWRERAENRIRDVLLECARAGNAGTDVGSPRLSGDTATGPRDSKSAQVMAEKRRSVLSSGSLTATPLRTAPTPRFSPSPALALHRSSAVEPNDQQRSPSLTPRRSSLEAFLARRESNDGRGFTPTQMDAQLRDAANGADAPVEDPDRGRFHSFGSGTPSFKRAALVAGGGGPTALSTAKTSPEDVLSASSSMENISSPVAEEYAQQQRPRSNSIHSSDGSTSRTSSRISTRFPYLGAARGDATTPTKSGKHVSPAPSAHSGEKTTGLTPKDSLANLHDDEAPSPNVQPKLGRARRANSSLSSLSESIRATFLRGGARSTEHVETTAEAAPSKPLPEVREIAARTPSPVKESGSPIVENEGSSWWRDFAGLRTRKQSEEADLSINASVDTLRHDRSSPTRTEAAPASADAVPAKASKESLKPAPLALKSASAMAALEPVPPSPAPSAATVESATTDDSEERRLWATFPEQSRRHPPGLIALELEQKTLAAARERERERERQRERDSDVEGTPRLSAINTTSGSSLTSSDAMAITIASPVSMLASDGSPADGLLATAAKELAKSPSQGGLIPIKEESWSSSLDSAASPTRSRASDHKEVIS